MNRHKPALADSSATPAPQAVASLLVSFRETAHITRETLASSLGITCEALRLIEAGKTPVPIDRMKTLQKALNLSDEQRNQLNTLAAPFRIESDRDTRALNRDWLAQQPIEKQAGLLLRAFRVRQMHSMRSLDNALELSFGQIYKWENARVPIPKSRFRPIKTKLDLSEPESEELKKLSAACAKFYKEQRHMRKCHSIQAGAALPADQCPELDISSGEQRER